MKKIKLTQGKSALVDDADFEWLSVYKWHISHYGYAVTTRNCKKILMHRLIMGAAYKTEVDHINHTKTDNRRSNLRVCSSSQNKQNSRLRSDNKSGYKGVSWDNRASKWTVSVWMNGKKSYVGDFKDKKMAAEAYNKKAYELFGEFARLNEVA